MSSSSLRAYTKSNVKITRKRKRYWKNIQIFKINRASPKSNNQKKKGLEIKTPRIGSWSYLYRLLVIAQVYFNFGEEREREVFRMYMWKGRWSQCNWKDGNERTKKSSKTVRMGNRHQRGGGGGGRGIARPEMRRGLLTRWRRSSLLCRFLVVDRKKK